MAKPLNTYTAAIGDLQVRLLKDALVDRGFEFESKPHALFAAKKGKLNVVVYEKGPKVLVQGRETEDFVKYVLEPDVLGEAKLGYEEVHRPEMFEPHFGIDESGKGDFFGPLTIAGVYTDATIARALMDAGVMDSKKIASDARIRSLADSIRAVPGIVCEVVRLGPARYNEMYGQFRNLNRLLAWGHARVIENLLIKQPDCPRALSDQFANPRELKRALQERGRGIDLQQRTKAESDIAVAAASILAREGFIDWLRDAGRNLGMEFPKGASAQVKAAARAFMEKCGEARLGEVAKLHFKTAGEISPNGRREK